MITIEFKDELMTAGLTAEQAEVYEVLLKVGKVPASQLAKEIISPLSRPLVYKILDELIALNLAEKEAPSGKIALFSARHPLALLERINNRKAEIEATKQRFEQTAGKLTSLYNLSFGKPGVQFFEGKDGVWEVLMDSLTATEEIYSYADIAAVEKYIPDLNAEYSALREDREVLKKVMVADTPQARKFISSYDHRVTKAKLVRSSSQIPQIYTIEQIYDNKISYITLTDNYAVGIIITDSSIAKTHRFIFESLWELTSGEII